MKIAIHLRSGDIIEETVPETMSFIEVCHSLNAWGLWKGETKTDLITPANIIEVVLLDT